MGLNSNCLNAEFPWNFFSGGSCTVPLAPQAAQPELLQTLPLHRPTSMFFSSTYTHLSAKNHHKQNKQTKTPSTCFITHFGPE